MEVSKYLKDLTVGLKYYQTYPVFGQFEPKLRLGRLDTFLPYGYISNLHLLTINHCLLS